MICFKGYQGSNILIYHPEIVALENRGVRYLGRTHFNIESGLYLNCELSSIAVNEDGTHIAVGSNENMGAVYDIEL